MSAGVCDVVCTAATPRMMGRHHPKFIVTSEGSRVVSRKARGIRVAVPTVSVSASSLRAGDEAQIGVERIRDPLQGACSRAS